MQIALPDTSGAMSRYTLTGTPVVPQPLPVAPARVVFAAAHVVADPFADTDPTGGTAIDWDKTMAFRRHLAELGLGIAEAMDTAQRGMGLDWPRALELIRRTKSELPDALIFNGCGTDHLAPEAARDLDHVGRAYHEQIDEIQSVGGRIILMASRALTRIAKTQDDYIALYGKVLAGCDAPVILHWLGEMFDPDLAGYWGSDGFEAALETALTVISENVDKVDGIKVSLLDKDKEIAMRQRLPDGVKMYTGDDFNYPELIAGDQDSHSHALLGIFDPIAPLLGHAIGQLGQGDVAGFRATLDPTVPLARLLFRAPTQHYKTGVVFLAWLNGFQDHFVMLNGAQARRPLPYFTEAFKRADQNGLLRAPDLAVSRMRALLQIYGA